MATPSSLSINVNSSLDKIDKIDRIKTILRILSKK